MTKDNVTYTKAYVFAIRIVKAYQYLCEHKKEYVLSKQMLRSGTSIGARHGKPLIFKVDAREMYANDFEFFVSENRVWLVERVPPKFLTVL